MSLLQFYNNIILTFVFKIMCINVKFKFQQALAPFFTSSKNFATEATFETRV